MAFENKSQTELLQLLNAGAAFSLDVGRKSQTELLQLLNATKAGGGHLTLLGLGPKSQTELLQLSNAGKGHITFPG